MSDAAAGGGGTGAAPSAPSSGASPAPQTGAAPAPSAAPAAPAKQPILFRPPDLDRDIDITEAVENHLKSYKRKVNIDGNESEVDLESAFRAAQIEPASKRRFDEAAKLRKQATAEMARIQAADAGMSDPNRVPSVLRKRLGDAKYEEMVLREAKEILAIDEMTPQQKAEIAARRKREMDIEERAQKVAAGELAQKNAAEEAERTKRQETANRRKKEWPPLIKSHAIPEGFVPDVMRATMDILRESHKHGIRITEQEAVARAAADLKKKFPAAAPPPPPTVEEVQKQPGRESPAETAPRDVSGRFQKKNGILRPDDIRARYQRMG